MGASEGQEESGGVESGGGEKATVKRPRAGSEDIWRIFWGAVRRRRKVRSLGRPREVMGEEVREMELRDLMGWMARKVIIIVVEGGGPG